MFCVRVAMRVKSEDRERFVGVLKQEERDVPARFAGCERFDVFADGERVLLYEEWATRDAAEAYLASDAFRTSGEVLFPLMDGAPDSAYYVAERVGP